MEENKLARFNNDIYDLDFTVTYKDNGKTKVRSFTDLETRIFTAIAKIVYERGEETITLPISEIKKLAEFKLANNTILTKTMENAQDALRSLWLEGRNENERIVMPIFSVLHLNEYALTCKVNKPFLYLFNNLFQKGTSGDTKVLIGMINRLNHYQQMMALLLVRYRTSGMAKISVEEFRRWLCIPESYDFNHIDTKILKPGVKELRKYFRNLEVKKIKDGRKVVMLQFDFDDVCDDLNHIFSDSDFDPYHLPF